MRDLARPYITRTGDATPRGHSIRPALLSFWSMPEIPKGGTLNFSRIPTVRTCKYLRSSLERGESCSVGMLPPSGRPSHWLPSWHSWSALALIGAGAKTVSADGAPASRRSSPRLSLPSLAIGSRLPSTLCGLPLRLFVYLTATALVAFPLVVAAVLEIALYPPSATT